MPWTDFQGHAHWNLVCWVPFQDASLHSRVSQVDVVTNLLLFVPFGFFYAIARSRNGEVGLLGPLLLSFLLAATAELYQVFCHNRIPSATDLTMNVLGAGIGALLATRVSSVLRAVVAVPHAHPAGPPQSSGDDQ